MTNYVIIRWKIAFLKKKFTENAAKEQSCRENYRLLKKMFFDAENGRFFKIDYDNLVAADLDEVSYFSDF